MRHKRRSKATCTGPAEFFGLGQTMKNIKAVAMTTKFVREPKTQYASFRCRDVKRTWQFAFCFPAIDVWRYLSLDKAAYALRDGLVGRVIIG